jgi:hypothetical protein
LWLQTDLALPAPHYLQIVINATHRHAHLAQMDFSMKATSAKHAATHFRVAQPAAFQHAHCAILDFILFLQTVFLVVQEFHNVQHAMQQHALLVQTVIF